MARPTILIPCFKVANLLVGFGIFAGCLHYVIQGDYGPEHVAGVILGAATMASAWSVHATTLSGMAWLGMVAWLIYKAWKASHFHDG